MGTGRALTAQLGNPGYLGRGHGKKEGLTRRAGHRLLNSSPASWILVVQTSLGSFRSTLRPLL